MAFITAETRSDLIALAVGMLNQAPSNSLLDELIALSTAGGSLADAAEHIAKTDAFKAEYPSFQTAEQYATELFDTITTGGTVSAAARSDVIELATGYIEGPAASMTKAGLALAMVDYLSKPAALVDAKYGDIAQSFQNRAAAAEYYVVTKELGGSTDAELAAAIASVTSDADTLTAANAAADAAADGEEVLAGQFSLTSGVETTEGNELANTFTANLRDGANTLQSGDVINGFGGNDSLDATLASSANFAISPETSSIETVTIRVQSTDANGNSSENNVDAQTGEQVTIDAQDMVGVTRWNNTDSRADLVIEDVRILDTQITRDITIGFHESDPSSNGDQVDYEFYFSPLSLRKEGGTDTTSLTLTISNPLSVADGYDAAKPLLDVPYDSFRFILGESEATGVVKNIPLDLSAVETYDDLAAALTTAIQAASAADPSLAGLTLTRAAGADSFFSRAGEARTADVFTLTLEGSALTAATIGWNATGGLPSDNAFSANVEQGDTTSTSTLVTSTVVLDNVGRESEGGNLTIGSMSTRDGVERFEVEVVNNALETGAYTNSGSWLSSLSSTNNTLQEVAVTTTSGTVGSDGEADYLYIGTGMDAAGNNLVTERGAPALLNADGISDVRLFDASIMTGDVKVGASIAATSIAKYQNLVDSQANGAMDDVEFAYTTGSGDDAIHIQIDGAVAASNSNIVVGREDFTFSVDGGAGNDHIQVALVDGLGGTSWYTNQSTNDNVTIVGGAGNDTIRTPGSGDANISDGSGNDAVYTDNTGAQAGVDYNHGRATWVMNAQNVDVNDLVGATAAAAAADVINLDLVVSYGNYDVTVEIAGDTGVTVTDAVINQAIKRAINNDENMKDLLVAEDGPGRSLIVRSLIDGAQLATDIDVSLVNGAAPSAGQTALGFALLTNAQANGLGFANFAAGVSAATAAGRYDPALGQDEVYNALVVAQTTAGSGTAQAVQTIAVDFSTPVNGATDTATAGGELSVTFNGNTYTVDYDLGATMTSIVASLQAAADAAGDEITFAEGADGGGAASDPITVTNNLNGLVALGSATNGVDTNLTGANATATSANVVTLGAGIDTVVLGSGTGADIVNITSLAGKNVIANFDVANDNIVYGTAALTIDNNVDGAFDAIAFTANEIDIDDLVAASNGTLALIQAAYTALDVAATPAAATMIYQVTQGGLDPSDTYYLVENGKAAGDVTVTVIDSFGLILV